MRCVLGSSFYGILLLEINVRGVCYRPFAFPVSEFKSKTPDSNKKASLLIRYGVSNWLGSKAGLFVMVVERKLQLSLGVEFRTFSPYKAFRYK
jgi:hypothetical protein